MEHSRPEEFARNIPPLGTIPAAPAEFREAHRDSSDIPIRFPDVAWANVNIGRIYGTDGHIGVDILLGPTRYNPGHHSDDSFYGACAMADQGPISYYKVHGFKADGSCDFPYGIFIDNENINVCNCTPGVGACRPWGRPNTPTLHHDWGKKIQEVRLEIYAYGSDFSSLQCTITRFLHRANGGIYSEEIGDILIPRKGGGVSLRYLHGFITENGIPISGERTYTIDGQGNIRPRMSVSVFQMSGVKVFSTTGVEFSSFAATDNKGSDFYECGVLMLGQYKVFVNDLLTGRSSTFDVSNRGERFDIDLARL